MKDTEKYLSKVQEFGHEAVIISFLKERPRKLRDLINGDLYYGQYKKHEVELPLNTFILFFNRLLDIADFGDKYFNALTWAYENNKDILRLISEYVFNSNFDIISYYDKKGVRKDLRLILREVNLATKSNLTNSDKELFVRAERLKELQATKKSKGWLSPSDFYEMKKYEKQLSQYVAFN